MKGDFYTIGQMATATGLSVKALRFYEGIGILAPHHIDPETRYRYYSRAQLMRLDIIKAARSMGMSLKELEPVLREKDDTAILDALARQGELVSKRIEELKRTAASIEAARAAVAQSLSMVTERGVYVRELPERRFVSSKIGASPSVESVALGYTSLERTIRERRLINTYETGILLAADAQGAFQASALFATVEIAADSDPRDLSALPCGSYFCVRYDEKSAASQQAKLMAHVRRRKLNPLLMLQADLLSDLLLEDVAKVELQVLVS
jgi:DNA-binding transcriptional MerR regulator